MTRGWRIGIAVALAVVAARAGAALLSDPPPPGGPASSTYATGSTGMAAYASLLMRHGHTVVRAREQLDRVALVPSDTVLVLDAPVRPEEAQALERFVLGGGTLVVGGASSGRWLGGLIDRPPVAATGAIGDARVLSPVRETAGVRTVHTGGSAGFDLSPAGSALPVLGSDTLDLALVADAGSGRVVLLADTSPLSNALLADADNAAFGLAIVPAGSRVIADELPHGYGRSEGLAAIPRSVQAALVGLGLAVLVFGWSRARRLGPPVRAGRPLAPPRAAYLDAISTTLARTSDRASATAPLRAEAQRQLLRRAAGGEDAEAGMAAAARALGLTDRESAAVLGNGLTDDDLLATGQALARIGASGGGLR